MRSLPGDFSKDVPEFTDEELEELTEEADRRAAKKRGVPLAFEKAVPRSPLREAKVRRLKDE